MLKYIGKRLIMLIPVILVTSFLIFWAMSLTGGDPALMLAGDNAKPEQIEQIREDLGLNDPFIVRYGNYMKGMLTGDMGKSYVTKRDVFKTFMERLPNTLLLGGAAVLIAVVVSLPLGIYTAIHQNTWKDTAGMIFALFGTSMPNFWLGLMLIIIFSLKLGLFPTGGKGRAGQPGAAGSDRRLRTGCTHYQNDTLLHAGCTPSGLHDYRAGKGLFREAGHHRTRFKERVDPDHHCDRSADVSGYYRLRSGRDGILLAGNRTSGI